MTDTPRCEPPPELRGVDGWHWVRRPNEPDFVCQWNPKLADIRSEWGRDKYTPDAAHRADYRYLAPVTPPAEVAALREALAQMTEDMLHEHQAAVDQFGLVLDGETECDILRATVAELVEALESIAKNTCCDGCQEAALVARAAIARVNGTATAQETSDE